MGRKILLDEKPPSSTGFVVESLEVVLDKKLLLGEKAIYGGGKSYWMKTSEFNRVGVESLEVVLEQKLLLGEKQSM